ncbi:MAG: nucleotide exchange factor GrpE [bacterium]|nr:nucleotide exchange factor GrpE [bacterium]
MDDKKNIKTLKPTVQVKNKEQEQIAELQKKLDEQTKIAEENKSKYLRALADYQNFENRTLNERMQLIKVANSGLILRLLPFLDMLDKAEIFIKDQSLKMVKDQFEKILKEIGLEEIELIGKEYDPILSEVVDMVEGEKDNVIAEVLRKGYIYNEKILRIAQVKVSKKTEVKK